MTETDTNGPGVAPDPNASQYLHRFLRDVGSFNLNVPGSLNQIPGQVSVGAIEKDTAGKDALGLDYDGNGKGAGFNIPFLLGIWAVPPYYHNGACETLACVLANPVHPSRQGTNGQADPLTNPVDQQRVVAFLKTLDAETDFPLNLSVRAHDLFFDPPTIFKGSSVVVGANISLFGTHADLSNLAADLGVTQLKVRFELAPVNGAASVDVLVPFSAFTQDFRKKLRSPLLSTFRQARILGSGQPVLRLTRTANCQKTLRRTTVPPGVSSCARRRLILHRRS